MALSGRARSTRGLVIMLVAVSLVTITLDYREGENGPLAKIGSAALSVITPLQEAVSKVTRPIGNFFSGISQVWSLESENRRLKAQLDEFRRKQVEFASIEQRFADISALLDMRDSLFSEMPTTGAQVVGNGFFDLEWVIQIDKGSDDGIEVGMPVVAASGLVGTVSQVGKWGSNVQLLIDPNASVAARLVTSQQVGLLQGRGEANPRMTLVSPPVEVSLDEPVVTTTYRAGGEQGLYPPDIPIGKVVDVEESSVLPDVEITVQPYVDFSALDVVLVVLTEGTE